MRVPVHVLKCMKWGEESQKMKDKNNRSGTLSFSFLAWRISPKSSWSLDFQVESFIRRRIDRMRMDEYEVREWVVKRKRTEKRRGGGFQPLHHLQHQLEPSSSFWSSGSRSKQQLTTQSSHECPFAPLTLASIYSSHFHLIINNQTGCRSVIGRGQTCWWSETTGTNGYQSGNGFVSNSGD